MQKKYRICISRNTGLLYKFFIITVMILVILNGVIASSYFNNKSAISNELTIKITNPEDNIDVSSPSVDVKGTINGTLPEGKYLWLLLSPHASQNNWQPSGSNGGRIEPYNGLWEIRNVIIGNSQNIGREFDIAVVLVNNDDKERLDRWLNKSKGGPDFPGMPLLGSKEDTITVKRV